MNYQLSVSYSVSVLYPITLPVKRTTNIRKNAQDGYYGNYGSPGKELGALF